MCIVAYSRRRAVLDRMAANLSTENSSGSAKGVESSEHPLCTECYGAGQIGLFGPVGLGVFVRDCRKCSGRGLIIPVGPSVIGHLQCYVGRVTRVTRQ